MRRRTSRLASLFAAAALVLGALALLPGCPPPSAAQSAEYTQIESKVLSDIAAGDTLETIETDVATIVTGNPLVSNAVVILVNDALQFLADLGVIPSGVFTATQSATARAMLTRLAPQVTTIRLAGVK